MESDSILHPQSDCYVEGCSLWPQFSVHITCSAASMITWAPNLISSVVRRALIVTRMLWIQVKIEFYYMQHWSIHTMAHSDWIVTCRVWTGEMDRRDKIYELYCSTVSNGNNVHGWHRACVVCSPDWGNKSYALSAFTSFLVREILSGLHFSAGHLRMGGLCKIGSTSLCPPWSWQCLLFVF